MKRAFLLFSISICIFYLFSQRNTNKVKGELISKDTAIYLEENQQLYLQASANSDLEAVCSYEVISSS